MAFSRAHIVVSRDSEKRCIAKTKGAPKGAPAWVRLWVRLWLCTCREPRRKVARLAHHWFGTHARQTVHREQCPCSPCRACCSWLHGLPRGRRAVAPSIFWLSCALITQSCVQLLCLNTGLALQWCQYPYTASRGLSAGGAALQLHAHVEPRDRPRRSGLPHAQ